MISASPVLRPLLAAACLAASGVAGAQSVVACRSPDYRYVECPAPALQAPQLVLQLPGSACIVNRSWGFDRHRRLIWVADGCAGRFADVDAYHHGASGGFDPGARRYTRRGEDAGAMVGGATLGALLAGEEARDGGAPAPGQTDAVGNPPPPPVSAPPAARDTGPADGADGADDTNAGEKKTPRPAVEDAAPAAPGVGVPLQQEGHADALAQ